MNGCCIQPIKNIQTNLCDPMNQTFAFSFNQTPIGVHHKSFMIDHRMLNKLLAEISLEECLEQSVESRFLKKTTITDLNE